MDRQAHALQRRRRTGRGSAPRDGWTCSADRDGSGTAIGPPRAGSGRSSTLEDVGCRLHPLGAGVVVGAEPAERQIGLGGQDEHEQRRRQGQVATEQPQSDRHRHQRHREGGQQFQDQRRQERHPQRGHRRGPVTVGDVADGARPGPSPDRIPSASAGRRPHPGSAPKDAAASAACRCIRTLVVAPTSAMKNGISGTVTAMISADFQSAPAVDDDHRQRHDDGQEQLRQVACEVAVQRVDPAGRQHHQAAGLFALDRRPDRGRRSDPSAPSAGRTSPRQTLGRPAARRASRPRPGRR